ncbi:endonuclease/exonuclease/phosphatase family protein [Teichococcus vastitatis]|uniref:Endonuclease/exonuclease/phosphatase family protein n=1 Tax=Teichococcus vastitatis TaxID=2307076 RepID=A0ABS9WCB1_9PROT|nr:endonuclease/exonuclease/phosphatase family protein [Pseudoroseomonas vastitatis]MCI0756390.1 endonuclease/exonuclease/phosphatase family protein [Pseudoroseomonas vastitatis]
MAWINELHYDNDGVDSGEFVEIAGAAGTDLTGWSLVLYNGSNGQSYNSRTLSGTIADQQGGFGTLVVNYPANGIQNGDADAVALVNAAGQVVQFLSYEGSITATNGPAAGLTSTDIGVQETGAVPTGESLQLAGIGDEYAEFTWSASAGNTPGSPNIRQTLSSSGDSGGEEPDEPEAPTTTEIYTIQGNEQRSGLEDQVVTTRGIVTAVDTNGGRGFYIQSAIGDGDDATSDAVFVFTNAAPTVQVGQLVEVTGTVDEYLPSGAARGSLPTTQIAATTSGAYNVVDGDPDASIAPTLIGGTDGRLPPTEDLAAGAAFFESLEGMLVTLKAPTAVSPTSGFGEIYTAVAGPDGQPFGTGFSARGTLNIDGGASDFGDTNTAGGDFNPERFQIDPDTGVLPGFEAPAVDVGARLGDVTGVVNYDFGQYQVVPTQAVTVTAESTLERETTQLTGASASMTVATYNAENLDPGDGAARFSIIAAEILNNLGAPDIVALQEVQDNDGPGNTDVTSAAETLGLLVAALNEAAPEGVEYAFADNPFVNDDAVGGEPGGNIRNAFLYRTDRVDLVEGSLRTVAADGSAITEPGSYDEQAANPDNPFYESRVPLAADFTFRGDTVTVLSNHFTSKGGSGALLNEEQPPFNGGEVQRAAQAQAVNNFVDGLLASDGGARIVVAGDLNDFEFEEPLDVLEGLARIEGYDVPADDPIAATATLIPGGERVLFDQVETLPDDERYGYVFDGNSQALDHILVSASLRAVTEYDIVHINAEFADQTSDHDPSVVRLSIGGGSGNPGGTPGATTGNDNLRGTERNDRLDALAGNDSLNGLGGNDKLFGGPGNDILRGAAGNDLLDGGEGSDTADYVLATRSVVIDLAAKRASQDGQGGHDRLEGIENIVGGAGNDTIRGDAGANRLVGGAGNDAINGMGGKDAINGGDGRDTLRGGLGQDSLVGGGGNDTFSIFAADLADGTVDTIQDFEGAGLRYAATGTDIIRFEGFNDDAHLRVASVSPDNHLYLYNIVDDSGTVGRFYLVSDTAVPLNEGASDYIFA